MITNLSDRTEITSTIFIRNDPFTNTSVEDTDNNSSETEESLQTLSLILQASVAFVGFIGNVITSIVLKRGSSISSGTTLRLLKNQAIVDAIVCFIGSIFVLQPPMWKTGVSETLDLLICQVRYIIVTRFYNFGLVLLQIDTRSRCLFQNSFIGGS